MKYNCKIIQLTKKLNELENILSGLLIVQIRNELNVKIFR